MYAGRQYIFIRVLCATEIRKPLFVTVRSELPVWAGSLAL
jgi:hypothetical protein